MKTELRMIFRNLNVQWIVVACLVILPVNVLTAVITSSVVESYEEKITDSYAGGLRLYVNGVDMEISYVQDQMTALISGDNLAAFTMGAGTDSVVQTIRLKDKMAVGRGWGGVCGYYFIWDKEKDIVSFFFQKKNYPLILQSKLEDALRLDGDGKDGFYTDTKWCALDTDAFLINRYDFPFYSFGAMHDVKEILKNYYESCGEIKGTVYLADEEGRLCSSYDAEGFHATVEAGLVDELSESTEYATLRQPFVGGTYELVYSMRRQDILHTLPSLIRVLFAFTILSFVAVPVLCLCAVRMVLKPLVRLCDAMEEVENGNLKYHLEGKNSNFQMDYLYDRFNHMVDELDHLIVNSYEREIEKLQGDAINMRLQVNQHMLLNFLNTIYSLSRMGKNDEVSDFTQLLMKYFRYVLRQNIALVPIREEMQFVNDYLKLQRVRFRDCFVSVYQMDEEAKDVLIPQLLLQNFVENSIKYGLVMGSEIEILINIRREGEKVCISICDTGNGMERDIVEKLQEGEIVEDKNGKHVGIWNCLRRLKYYYGEHYDFHITSEIGGGTQVWMELPAEPLKTEDNVQTVRRLEQERFLRGGRT